MKKLYSVLVALVLAISSLAQTPPPTGCSAAFTTTRPSPSTVAFFPGVVGDSLYTYHLWIFGDGTSSSLPNPVHTYANNGTYSVSHIIRRYNGGVMWCYDSTGIVIQINGTVAPCNTPASFYSVLDTSNNRTVWFTNTTPVTANGTVMRVKWTFGDGTMDTAWTSRYGTHHTYTHPGIYAVCLRIQYTSCFTEICDSIVIPNNNTTPCTERDTFRYRNCALAGTTGYIKDSARYNCTTRTWSQWYVVKNTCTSTACNFPANFTWTRDTSRGLVHFTNTTISTSNPTSVRWTFGDGTADSAYNPHHRYRYPGLYRVCLRMVYPNCIAEKCDTVRIPRDTTYPYSTNTNNYLTAYPNPTSTGSNVTLNLTTGGTVRVYVYNSQYHMVSQFTMTAVAGSNQIHIDLTNFPTGMYYVRIYCNGVWYRTRIFKS